MGAHSRVNDLRCMVAGCDAYALDWRKVCQRHRRIGIKYSLSDAQVISFLSSACQVCGSSDRLTIDHDHSCCDRDGSCGECVRGVLCMNCNTALGMVDDSADILIALAAYLRAS
jgi:hypothetical protein